MPWSQVVARKRTSLMNATFKNNIHNSQQKKVIHSKARRAGRSPGSVLLDMTDRSESPVQFMALIAKQFPSRIAVVTTKEGSRKIAEINFDPLDPAIDHIFKDDEFDLLDKHYTTARYKSIINTHHLSSEKERLESELALFKQSKEYKLYWLERSRRKTQLNTYESCAEYVQDVVEQETTALTSTTPTSITTSLITVYNSSSSHGTPTSTAMSDTTIPISHITNTITDTIGTTDAAAAEYQELIFAATETVTDDVENTTPLEPWMFQGTNVAELFTKF
ncbi:hypothetical protein G6F61_006493 [Rhizopus arrhizus]|nr:hypothetical protein G6F61_006493 [Rhizopus arrhizus]